MKCDKCGGNGRYKDNPKFECFPCEGSGEKAEAKADGSIVFQGYTYSKGMTIVFLSTASKQEVGEVIEFYIKGTSFKLPVGPCDIADVWMHLLNLKTDKDSCRPMRNSIEIRKAGEIFFGPVSRK